MTHVRRGGLQWSRTALVPFVLLLHVDFATGQCSLVRSIDDASAKSVVAALVRGARYTVKEPSGCSYAGAQCSKAGLDPQCGSAAGSECTETPCAADGALDVRFNSRTYVLAKGMGAASAAVAETRARSCDGTSLKDDGTPSDYSCVDYRAGAFHLAGKSLKFTVDLSGSGCGCNAAVYLVSMPQNTDATVCKDYYCDANNVCGVPCVEIDLMEANKVAFVSTVHVGDDPNGEGFGVAHYVTKRDKRLRSERGDDCAYGPRESCTIDTNRKFTAIFSFSSAGAQFGYSLVLEQDGGQRRATLGAQLVRYMGKPGKGNVGSADEANVVLTKALASGMTLVVSHWAGKIANEMAWLDQPCTPAEQNAWRCSDEWNEHVGWPWTCEKAVRSASVAPACSTAFTISEIEVHAGLLDEVISAADPASIAQGVIVLAALAALVWSLRQRHAEASRGRAQGAALVPVEERPRKGRKLPVPKKRGAPVVSSAVSDDESDEQSSDEEVAPPARAKGKGKGKGKGGATAASTNSNKLGKSRGAPKY